MKVFGRRVGIARPRKSLRNSKDASEAAASHFLLKTEENTAASTVSMSTTTNETETTPTADNETMAPTPTLTLVPISQRSQKMSPLSILVSKFISDNARKTHDSIQDEKERRDFLSDLRESLKSVRNGEEQPARRSVSSMTTGVIDFFAEATKSTLFSIEDEEERIYFEEHLTRELLQNFNQPDETVAEDTTMLSQ